ncbi:hypothetical protein HPP92_023388 [Vanilla planifolia]|uniref:Uncharacterized protein n=1 Tax=Vanilla planifolia TaxID=51239 RepID=A0A835PX71_VANPL|nr:hypothetical protein HPP92_023388 [Vanilla planifolia]
MQCIHIQTYLYHCLVFYTCSAYKPLKVLNFPPLYAKFLTCCLLQHNSISSHNRHCPLKCCIYSFTSPCEPPIINLSEQNSRSLNYGFRTLYLRRSVELHSPVILFDLLSSISFRFNPAVDYYCSAFVRICNRPLVLRPKIGEHTNYIYQNEAFFKAFCTTIGYFCCLDWSFGGISCSTRLCFVASRIHGSHAGVLRYSYGGSWFDVFSNLSS